jgi:hypothetical protein
MTSFEWKFRGFNMVSHQPNSVKVIARLKGGIGNQLFIYANAYAYSKRHGCKLLLDGYSGFLRDRYKRSDMLSHFNTSCNDYSMIPLLYFFLRKLHPIVAKYLLSGWYFVCEKNVKRFHRLADPCKGKKGIILEGQWQSPRYFKDSSTRVLGQFQFKEKDRYESNVFYKTIISTEAIAVHVRRVEYKNVLSLSYYVNCVKYMNDRIKDPVYFIFSDDLAWCRSAFSWMNNVQFVEYPNQNDVEDLFLMSRCRSFIIANSTFSWWGAWMATSNDKIVIAPKEFKLNHELYDERWIEI